MEYKNAYERLIEAVRVLLKANPSDEGIQNWAKNNVPEIFESEDERIRKAISQCVEDMRGPFEKLYGVHHKAAIDWLEKKGEQKPITFNDAHIIDSALNDYCCKQYGALHKENGGVLSFARLQHLAMDIYGWCKKQDEQKPAPLDCDTICDNAWKDFVKRWNEEAEKYHDAWIERVKGAVSEKTKAQKQEWSEEDRKIIIELIGIFGSAVDGEHVAFPYRLLKDYIRVLKSCLHQSTWKPSDEQIEALALATLPDVHMKYQEALKELYEDLCRIKARP